MKIVFTAQGNTWESQMDARFGRAKFFVIYDEETDKLTTMDNSDVEKEAHGAGPIAAQKIAESKAKVMITGNGPGGNAGTVLQKLGVKSFIGAGEFTLKQAYDAYKNGELKEF